MTTKTLTEKVLSIAKPLAVATLIAVAGTYAVSCTPKYKLIFERTQKAPETYQIPLDYNGNNRR